MEVLYRFYLHNQEDEYIQYSSETTTKKQMDRDVVLNIFPDSYHCIREKWIDWKMHYRNIFLLQARRNNPEFISLYKSSWIMNRHIYYKN